MTATVTTSVVVCAYALQRWDDIVTALGSVVAQSPAPDEIILVVDHNDELARRSRTELLPRTPELRVIMNGRARGLSGARNTAIEHASGDVILFLDDDAAARPGWLAALCAPYVDAAVVAVGGVAEPCWDAARPTRPSSLPAASDRRGELDWVVGCSFTGQPDVAGDVRNVMGCNMSFRRSVFEAVGGFSEHLGRIGKTPLGCEETELCIRAVAAAPGSRVVFEPGAAVSHHVDPDRGRWSYLRRRSWAEGVSKAAVAGMVGRQSALSTERRYVAEVLPRAFGRQLRTAVAGPGRRTGLAGALAIFVALAATSLGYLRGRVAQPAATLSAVVEPLRMRASTAVMSPPSADAGRPTGDGAHA